MFLKSIELKGFKSFADRTHIDFLPGVTCIVGPNGCGKSNIIDAIRWVLGEQSSTSLRARRMEDVIFSGTKHRAAQNFASVKLVFSEAQGISPGGRDELSIERILHRSGESTYKINSQAVRLKDLRQLFMDTAVGVTGYSLISQGDIDDILKENKQERRKIFEEASGISLIHYKKEEAKRRLARVEDHYLRMMDILAEIEERRLPLKEERDRALEYLDLSKRIRDLDLFYSKEDYINLEGQEADITRELARLSFDVDKLQEEKTGLLEKREESRARAQELERQYNLLQELIRDKTESRDQDYLDLRLGEERLRQLQRELDKLAEDPSYLDQGASLASMEDSQEKVRETELRLVELAQKMEGQAKLIELSSRDLRGLTQRRDDVEKLLGEAAASLEEQDQRISELTGLRKDTSQALEELEVELGNYASEREKLQLEEGSLTRKRIRLDRSREEINQAKDLLEEERSHLVASRAQLNSSLGSLKKTIGDYERWVREGEMELEAEREKLGGSILYKLLKPKKGYEKALEAALGQAISSLDLRNEKNQWEKSQVSLLYELPDGIEVKDINSLGPLSDFIQGPRDLVKGLLGNILVYENLELALKGPKASVRISLEGQRLEGGFYFPWDSAPSPLEISQSLEESRWELGQTQEELARLEGAIDGNSSQLGELASQEKNYLEEERLFQEERAGLGARKAKLHSLEEIASFKLRQFEETFSSLESQLSHRSTRCHGLRQELSQLEIERAKLLEILSNDSQENLESLQEDYVKLRLEEAAAKEELKRWQAQLENQKIQSQEQKKREEHRSKQRLLQQQESRKLTDEIDQLRESYSKIQLDIKRLDEEAFGLKKELDQLREGFSQEENKRELIDQELLKLQEEKGKKEVSLSRLEERRAALSQEIWNKYELSMLQVKELELSCDEPRTSRKKIRRDMEKLEPVNLKAPQEFEEVDQRYNFLQEQLGDIERGRTDLQNTISSLERRMKEDFVQSFEAIRENFHEIFSHLFRGGQGDIMLEDPSDVLGSDIIILASPPGKKLQHMNLLSGGEKALTAIALLFAVLKTKPAPFYVLDEIEAALDDINIQRFGSFLEEFSLGSQFILITHRKGTMEFADALYGVSMEEKGVSSLISLKMEE